MGVSSLQITLKICRNHYLNDCAPMDVSFIQSDRGFTRLRLCTNDGTTNNLLLYTVRNASGNDTSKKGGNALCATD